ncbi:MAG: TRAP transporter large permease [Defluviitaleaceae bacterium]|nr:TRAP transporter large permease [Defluviitaleaceae bacterium]
MMLLVTFLSMFGFMLVGLEVFASMAAAGILYLIISGNAPLNLVAANMIQGMQSFTLLAIPFFILVGELMNVTGMTKKLIDLIQYFLAPVKGGLAHAAITMDVILSCVSGSAPANAAACATVLVPAMKKEKYPDDFAAAINCVSSVVGPIIPPSILMVVLATLLNMSVGRLFMGGIIAGLMMSGSLYIVAAIKVRNMDLSVDPSKYRQKPLYKVFLEALPGLMAPMIIIVGVLTGVATITEISILACSFVMFVGFFITRTLSPRKLLQAFKKAILFASAIMALFGVLGTFTFFMAVERVDVMLSNFIFGMEMSPWMFLLMVNIFFLVIGMIMDALPLMTIFMPVFMPVAMSLGIDPIHFGVLVVVNLSIGLCTPPIGGLLFVVQKISGVPIDRIVKQTIPFVAAMLVVLIIITYIPQVTLFLPNLIFGGGA